MEAWGTGLPRIINRCREYGLPAPLFEEFGDGFKVTLFRKVSNAFDKYLPLLEEANATDTFINNIEKVYGHCGAGTPLKPFHYIRLSKWCTCPTMEWLKCSKSKATNIMNVLKKANVIEKVTGMGAGRYSFLDL